MENVAPITKNRGLPYHLESEQCVLGALLLSPVFTIPHVLGYLSEDDFYSTPHKRIFRACQTLHRMGAPVDCVTVATSLDGDPEIESVGGLTYIGVLVEQTPTAQNVAYYARLVKADSERRRRILAAHTEIEDAYTEEIVPPQSWHALSDVLDAVLDSAHTAAEEGRYGGYESGFVGLDNYLGGFHPGELYIIAGRPSMGKSAFCAQTANFIRHAGGRVVFFPLETGIYGLARNIAAMATKTETWKLRQHAGKHLTAPEAAALEAYLTLQRQGTFVISQNATPGGMKMTLREVTATAGGVDVVVVDHLQEMNTGTRWMKRHYEIESILQDLRHMAREFAVPVILAAQVGRSAEGKEPSLAEIKDCGSIEQIADVVLILHGVRGDGERTLTVAKHRSGPTGKVRLHLEGKYLHFSEIEGL